LQLTFLGAIGTVTGSKYLIKSGNKQLLVDCGLYQGRKELRERNWLPFPVAPDSIDAVILTHAHIDHSGYLPLLVKNGFNGPIFATKATKDLCKILLADSAYLQEEEAKNANKYGWSRHSPALPLYTVRDAESALKLFQVIDYGREHRIFDELTVELQRSGHILGSSFVTLCEGNTKLTFSGDLGRPKDPILHPPVQIQNTDYLVLESTYGDRQHSNSDPQEQIAAIINKTVARGGTVVVPAFAVGRAQTLLYHIYMLKRDGKIDNVPVYLDSPMAVNATDILANNMSEHHLSPGLCKAVCGVATYVSTVEDSKQIDALTQPKIIISASGMASGGRVLHHLKALISDPKNTILFTGYQDPSTRGDQILKGEHEVKIHGQIYEVKAEIAQIINLSAHADADEIVQWLRHFKRQPRKVFITHGEVEAALALKERIERELGWQCQVPKYLDSETL
jgi:metallo-beta-lactamase family protein